MKKLVKEELINSYDENFYLNKKKIIDFKIKNENINHSHNDNDSFKWYGNFTGTIVCENNLSYDFKIYVIDEAFIDMTLLDISPNNKDSKEYQNMNLDTIEDELSECIYYELKKYLFK